MEKIREALETMSSIFGGSTVPAQQCREALVELATLSSVPEDVARLVETIGAGISPLAIDNLETVKSARHALSRLATAAARVPGLEAERIDREMTLEVVVRQRDGAIAQARAAESERDAALKARDEKLTPQAAQRDSALREVAVLTARVAELEQSAADVKAEFDRGEWVGTAGYNEQVERLRAAEARATAAEAKVQEVTTACERLEQQHLESAKGAATEGTRTAHRYAAGAAKVLGAVARDASTPAPTTAPAQCLFDMSGVKRSERIRCTNPAPRACGYCDEHCGHRGSGPCAEPTRPTPDPGLIKPGCMATAKNGASSRGRVDSIKDGIAAFRPMRFTATGATDGFQSDAYLMNIAVDDLDHAPDCGCFTQPPPSARCGHEVAGVPCDATDPAHLCSVAREDTNHVAPAPGLREAVGSVFATLKDMGQMGALLAADAEAMAVVGGIPTEQWRNLMDWLERRFLSTAPEPVVTHAQIAAVVEEYVQEQKDSLEDYSYARADGAREVLRRVTGGEVPEVSAWKEKAAKWDAAVERARNEYEVMNYAVTAYLDAGHLGKQGVDKANVVATAVLGYALGLTLPTGPGGGGRGGHVAEGQELLCGHGSRARVMVTYADGTAESVTGSRVEVLDLAARRVRVHSGPGGGESCHSHPGQNCAPETPGVYECRAHEDTGRLLASTPITPRARIAPTPKITNKDDCNDD